MSRDACHEKKQHSRIPPNHLRHESKISPSDGTPGKIENLDLLAMESIVKKLKTFGKNVVPDETRSAAADVETCFDLRPSSSVLQLTRMVRESARKTFDALAEAFGQPYGPALGRGAGTAYVGE